MSSAETSVEIVFHSLKDCEAVYQLFKQHNPNNDSHDGYARATEQLTQLGFKVGGLFTDTASLWVGDIIQSVDEAGVDEANKGFSVMVDFVCGHRVGYKLTGELSQCFSGPKVISITTAQLNDSSFFWSYSCRVGDKECHFSIADDNDAIYQEFTEKNLFESVKRICLDSRLNQLVNSRR